jgi:hypothetical protein
VGTLVEKTMKGMADDQEKKESKKRKRTEETTGNKSDASEGDGESKVEPDPAEEADNEESEEEG